jgi:hypothetical protein
MAGVVVFNIDLKTKHEFRKADVSTEGEYCEHTKRDSLLPVFNVRDKAAVNSKVHRHLKLRNISRTTKLTKSQTESRTNIARSDWVGVGAENLGVE